jgi:Predicted transcriptional regulators
MCLTLGERLRTIRESLNLNIAELAKRTSMTSSHISQIERDITSPSVSALRKIARELNVPISTFFAGENTLHGAVVSSNTRKRLKLPNSNLEYELLSPDFTKMTQLLLTRIDPGAESSEEPMGHNGEECALILGGSIQVVIGDQEYILKDGDSIYYEGTIPHKFLNISDTVVTIISAISPPGF